MPSTRVTNLVKKLFKPNKVGHAGTLDPLAEGLLPIAVGEATKTIEFFHSTTKTYQFEVIFGKKSATGDLEGEILKTTNILPNQEDLQKIIPKFTGDITQIPPKYSAIKIDGKRAYDLARKGEEFEIKEREVTIFNLKILNIECNISQRVSKAIFEAECSLGTYIRTLAEDIAEKVNSLGVVSILKRTKYGCFTEETSLRINLDENKKVIESLQSLEKSIIDNASLVDVVLDDIPVLHLDATEVARLRMGQRLKIEANEGFYRVYEGDKFSLIANQRDEVLRPYKVFNL